MLTPVELKLKGVRHLAKKKTPKKTIQNFANKSLMEQIKMFIV